MLCGMPTISHIEWHTGTIIFILYSVIDVMVFYLVVSYMIVQYRGSNVYVTFYSHMRSTP